MISLITDHIEQARLRLRQMYRGRPTIDALLVAVVTEVQTLEEVLYGMSTNRSVYDAEGVQLDLLGELLSTPRQGFEDELYRIRLLAKIAQNVSRGTPEDVINVFKLLMRARYVQLEEVYPAKMNLTAVGANQIGDINDIKAAVDGSALAGVRVELYSVVSNVPFVFAEDPDPFGQGWGSLTDPTVGGEWNNIV